MRQSVAWRALGFSMCLLAGGIPGRAASGPPLVLRAGVLIDGTGSAPQRNVKIVVVDGRITEVGTDIKPPAGHRTIDLSDRTVLPGFIDAHTHLTGRTIGEGSPWARCACA